jgi:thiol-disulfide isomerase/thioredoxin
MSRSMHILIGVLAAVAVAGAILAAVLNHTPRVEVDVMVIAHGEEVVLTDHLVTGKYTVVDFYAVWCPPCRILSPALERLAQRHPSRLAIRKVDIVDWTMPVAAQHGIESLPHLLLFDPDRDPVANGEAVFEALGRIFGDSAREVMEVSGIERAQAP